MCTEGKPCDLHAAVDASISPMLAKTGLDMGSFLQLGLVCASVIGTGEDGKLAFQAMLIALAKKLGNELSFGDLNGSTMNLEPKPTRIGPSTEGELLQFGDALKVATGLDLEQARNIAWATDELLGRERSMACVAAVMIALGQARGHEVVFGDFGGYSGVVAGDA